MVVILIDFTVLLNIVNGILMMNQGTEKKFVE
jgi:hypothetical protein